MSLAPRILSIKRKATDSPIDTLIVETEFSKDAPYGEKRRRTDSVYRFVRLRDDQGSHSQPTQVSSQDAEITHSRHSETRNGASHHGELPIGPRTEPAHVSDQIPSRSQLPKFSSGLSRSASPRPGKQPRRFLLTKETFSESISGRQSPHHGINKKRNAAKGRIAVFSEQKLSMLRSMASMHSLAKEKNESREASGGLETSQTFKRPKATSQERQWRAENWHSRGPRSDPSVSPLPGSLASRGQSPTALSRDEMRSLKLAATLQQFALEATAPPNPPVDHPRKTVPTETPQINAHVEDEESGWVYDRYVRHAVDVDMEGGLQTDELGNGIRGQTPSDNAQGSQPRAFGILVIRDQDKEDWEAFAEVDAEDDEEGYTEDEDSNAEDFYANDYPEAELSSDDEYDLPGAAYRAGNRTKTSDDEYDLANDAYSDDDSYGFSSADEGNETHDPAWKRWRSASRPRRVEQMVNAGDDSD